MIMHNENVIPFRKRETKIPSPHKIEVDEIGIMEQHPKAKGKTIALGPNTNRDKIRAMPDMRLYSNPRYMETLYWCGENEHQFAFGTVKSSIPSDIEDFEEMTSRLREALIRAGKKYGNESVRNLWCVCVFHGAVALEWKRDKDTGEFLFYIPLGMSVQDIQSSIEKKMIEEDVIIDDGKLQ